MKLTIAVRQPDRRDSKTLPDEQPVAAPLAEAQVQRLNRNKNKTFTCRESAECIQRSKEVIKSRDLTLPTSSTHPSDN